MPSLPSSLRLARIADLRPTQITVGFREVAQKRLRWRPRLRRAGLVGIPVAPVVLGPAGALYLIDRHHLIRAVAHEGLSEVRVRPIADFRALAAPEVWPALDARGWCHPYDADGRRRPFSEIPPTLDALCDDPHRSLASALRRAGGFSKGAAPYSEFAWAEFLRQRISTNAITLDFDRALDDALRLARMPMARNLPGWRPNREAVPTGCGAPPRPHALS